MSFDALSVGQPTDVEAQASRLVTVNIVVSGRTLTPFGWIVIDGKALLASSAYSYTLTGSSATQYDLVAMAMGDGTWGLSAANVAGTTPPAAHGTYKIGVVNDIPADGTCQVLLLPSLAFQSDQYVSIQSDGLHIKAFAQLGNLYGNLIVENPGGGRISLTAGGSTSAYVQTSGMDLNLTALSLNTNVNVTAARGNVVIQAGNPGPGLSAHVGTLTANIYGDIALHAGSASPFLAAAINLTATGASTWTMQDALTITAGAGGAGNLLITNANGTVSLTATGAALTLTGAATSTWSLSAGDLTISTATGTITLSAGSGTINVTGTMQITGTVVSKGAAAGLVAQDRTGTNQLQWFRNATQFFANTSESGTIWTFDGTTGIPNLKTAWTAVPTLQNAWVNTGTVGGVTYKNAEYCQDIHGHVWLRGSIKNGTATAGTLLFTLPSGFRPAADSRPFACASAGGYGEARVDSNGQVLIIAGVNGNFSLNNVHFDTR